MNKNFLIVLIVTLAAILCCSGTALQMPILQKKMHTPLYEGIKLLIADERFTAQSIWNETAYHLSEASYVLVKTMDELSHYNPAKRLSTLNDMIKHPNWQKCYKAFELEIAHFNREFVTKYNTCKQTLDIATTHLEDETFEEIDFIRNAAIEIQRVQEICKVSDLNRQDQNDAGIILCVIAHIGRIEQRLSESSQLIFDIIAEITMSADIDDDNCHEYNELKQEFDKTYFAITNCLEQHVI